MTILFKDLILDYSTEIKTYMVWENYELNDVTIPVVEMLKDHALIVLMNSYGSFHVEQNIIDALCADVFIYFPILMQQLAISRLMDAYGVVKDDVNTEELTRTERTNTEIDQNSQLTVGTTISENNILDTEQKTTGTVRVETDMSNTQNSQTTIENTSGVESTGSRSVNLNYNMPEQSLNGSTGNFPKDQQGTPILDSSYAQSANENFNTSNPINTSETSEQNISNTTTGNNDATTTNDVTVSDSGTTTRTVNNSGSDNSKLNSSTDGTTDIVEKRTITATNKQYAYEIKAFLESTDTLVAFSRWEDKFSWVVGIV